MALSSQIRRGTSSRASDDIDVEPGSWECTDILVCTFRNEREAYKCQICDTRKGTSTRKPRLNPTVVHQQTLVQNLAIQQNLIDKKRDEETKAAESSAKMQIFEQWNTDGKVNPRMPVPFKDSIVARSSARKRKITVNEVSFLITEFKPRISPCGRKNRSALSSNENESQSQKRAGSKSKNDKI